MVFVMEEIIRNSAFLFVRDFPTDEAGNFSCVGKKNFSFLVTSYKLDFIKIGVNQDIMRFF